MWRGGGMLALLGGSLAGAALAQPAPDDGHVLIETHCAACHDTAQVFTAKKAPADWATTLDTMQGYGATLAAPERQRILEYLVAHNGA
jgi:cytochrome c5